MGKLHFDPDHEKFCDEPDDNVFNRTLDSSDLTPFYLARRGDCSFVQKVRLMEGIGVAVGIVVDDKAEQIDDKLMSDDGTGNGIRIPSMLIGKKDGDKLLKWMSNMTKEEYKTLVVMCEFEMAFNDQDKVFFDFWYTSSSARSLDFLEDFHPMEEKLHGVAEFTPHFVFWDCPDCDPNYTSNDCFGGGKYCALEPSNMNIKGQEIILEDLRQACLW
jgi:hypothetical protein